MSDHDRQGRGIRIGRLVVLVALFWSVLFLLGPHSVREIAAQEDQDVYKRVYSGWKWWHVYCYRCHGLDVLGSNLAPNLRESFKVLTYKDFLHIVREGRPKKGMQSWKQLLDDKQITDIYIYVNARSEGILLPGRPDEIGPKAGPWVPPQGWSPKHKEP